jgi:hypothetical protein
MSQRDRDEGVAAGGPRLTDRPRLTLDEARKQLHGLSRLFGSLRQPSESLLDRAVEVGPHRKGGLLIVPEIDALAALERLEQTEREKEDLLEELEDVGIVLLAQERLAEPTPVDQLIPLEELARQFGREHMVAE